MTVKTTVLRNVAMVMINISIWSGAKKLQASDFINVDADDLPSNRVASFGIKHLIDKERLQPFKTIRGQADRLCTKYGTRFLGGYAIPQDCVDQVGQELKALCNQFEREIDGFMVEYDQATEEWIASNPEFSEPIRRAILPPPMVRSRFKASYSIFEVEAHPLDRTQSMLSSENDLLESVLNGVVTSVKPYLERKSGANANSFRVEVRQTVTDIAQKIRRFSFMDPSGGMKVLADDLENAVNGTGKIKGEEFNRLWNIISHFTSSYGVRAEIASRAGAEVKPQDLRKDQDKAPAPVDPPLGEKGFELNTPSGTTDSVPDSSGPGQAGSDLWLPELDLDSGYGDKNPIQNIPDKAKPVETQPEFRAVFDW